MVEKNCPVGVNNRQEERTHNICVTSSTSSPSLSRESSLHCPSRPHHTSSHSTSHVWPFPSLPLPYQSTSPFLPSSRPFIRERPRRLFIRLSRASEANERRIQCEQRENNDIVKAHLRYPWYWREVNWFGGERYGWKLVQLCEGNWIQWWTGTESIDVSNEGNRVKENTRIYTNSGAGADWQQEGSCDFSLSFPITPSTWKAAE